MNVVANQPTVFVVDDDASIRKSLSRLLAQEGWRVATFDSAEAFLGGWDAGSPGCLLLDVDLPGLDGLELQRRLSASGQELPIVFITGQGDIPMTVRAMKAGAIDFLPKPVDAATLFSVVRAGIAQDAESRERRAEQAALVARFASLTEREREVLVAVAAGRLNKQIAADLGIVEQTVKFHRARIMEKLGADTTAQLMVMAAQMNLDGRPPD
jgi:FixJ family two-component response regulator